METEVQDGEIKQKTKTEVPQLSLEVVSHVPYLRQKEHTHPQQNLIPTQIENKTG